MSVADLRASLAKGLHTDNLRALISECSALIKAGISRVPLFVLQGCLDVLLDLKDGVPVSAAAVADPDSRFAELADRLLAALEAGQGGAECWGLLDDLASHISSLPSDYPTG